MIRGNDFLHFFLIFALFSVTYAEFSPTGSIVSNEIYVSSGSGDTLWILNSHGVNFSIDVADSASDWFGFSGLEGYNVCYGGGYGVAFLNGDGEQTNTVFLYNHAASEASTVTFPYKKSVSSKPDAEPFYFHAIGGLYAFSNFWLTMYDGGVLKYDPVSKSSTVFKPGKDKTAIVPSQFSPDSSYPALSRQLVSIDILPDSSALFVAATEALWLFNFSDTTWVKIPPPTSDTSAKFSEVKCAMFEDTAVAYLLWGSSDDSLSLSRYRFSDSSWVGLTSSFISDFAVGVSNDLFIHRAGSKDELNRIRIYAQENSLKDSVIYSKNSFKARMISAGSSNLGIEINSIFFNTTSSDTILAISTNRGLYLSVDEYADEKNNSSMRKVYRNVRIDDGLKKVYSYPSIITGESGREKANFAYNLSEDDYVTIDIFDYNMDFVTNIISSEFRKAGKNNSLGRSNYEGRDCWDGTIDNMGGGRVAPGIYYYKIKTDKGYRAFGKVIVAKN